ncbi:hypothetical protein [uncultured Bifidobacterium sp.]|uniref:hypothetical protein n=1 Tax=uncultured Bifidobacterium sp. TaxID=165187 RepID=UPI002622124A|nr:hypothetical protein [uncultured Bifidobacterium sp.]
MFAIEQPADDARGKLRHRRVYTMRVVPNNDKPFCFVAFPAIAASLEIITATAPKALPKGHVKPFSVRPRHRCNTAVFDAFARFVSSYKLPGIFLVASYNADLRARNLCYRGRDRATFGQWEPMMTCA